MTRLFLPSAEKLPDDIICRSHDSIMIGASLQRTTSLWPWIFSSARRLDGLFSFLQQR